MSLRVLLVLLMSSTWLSDVVAYPGGAPPATCASMTPNHQSNVGQPLGGANGGYSVSFSSAKYNPGQTHQVTISSTTQFKGFQCQVHNNASQRVGTFVNLPSNAKTVGCTPANSAATHNSRVLKSSIVLPWRAPSAGTGTIKVLCTVVQKFNTFWVKIPSADISESTKSTTPAATTASASTKSTTPAAITARTSTLGTTTAASTTNGTPFPTVQAMTTTVSTRKNTVALTTVTPTTNMAGTTCTAWKKMFLLMTVLRLALHMLGLNSM